MKKLIISLLLLVMAFTVGFTQNTVTSIDGQTHEMTTTTTITNVKTTESFLQEINNITDNAKSFINTYLNDYDERVNLVVDSCTQYINTSVTPDLRVKWLETLDFRDRLNGFLDPNASPLNNQICLDALAVADSINIDRADSIAMLNTQITNLQQNQNNIAAVQAQLNQMTVERDNCLQSQGTCVSDLAQCQADLAIANAAVQFWQDSSNYWKALALAGGGGGGSGSGSGQGTAVAYWTYFLTQGNVAFAYVFKSEPWSNENITVTDDQNNIYSAGSIGNAGNGYFRAYTATTNTGSQIVATTTIDGQTHETSMVRNATTSSRYRIYNAINVPSSVTGGGTYPLSFEGQDFVGVGISNGNTDLEVGATTRIGSGTVYMDVRTVFTATPN